jgi:hypothetical protein
MHEKWNQVLQISNANIHETQPKLEESHTKEQSHQRNQNWLAKVGDRARDPHEHPIFFLKKTWSYLGKKWRGPLPLHFPQPWSHPWDQGGWLCS